MRIFEIDLIISCGILFVDSDGLDDIFPGYSPGLSGETTPRGHEGQGSSGAVSV